MGHCHIPHIHGVDTYCNFSNLKKKKTTKKPRNIYYVLVRAPLSQESALEEMVEQIGVAVGFVSKPKGIRDGQAAMCILRPLSAKELSQKEKKKATAPQPSTVNEDPTEGAAQP